ncbi:MAG: hypothetical protein ACR2M2_03885 [Gaiellaceae bacterium]
MIDGLSLNTVGAVSLITTLGSLHVRPPFVDLEASRAWSKSKVVKGGWRSLNERLSWYAIPVGPKVTHGSVAR